MFQESPHVNSFVGELASQYLLSIYLCFDFACITLRSQVVARFMSHMQSTLRCFDKYRAVFVHESSIKVHMAWIQQINKFLIAVLT